MANGISKLFMGAGFLLVSFACFFFAPAGRIWWFWMLIPGFASLGRGIAQLIQMQESKKSGIGVVVPHQGSLPQTPGQALPPSQTTWEPRVESRYKTGDLVPPSVTDATTRHLEMDSEGQTLTLPKK